MAKKQPEKNKNLKNVLYPIVIILLAVLAVILIIFMTQNSKAELQAKLPEESENVDPMATPFLVGDKQYSSAPPMLIDTTKKYSATFTLAKGGTFTVELYADKAPITVNSFVFLARQGYYDGTTFHRVLENFMAQGGDPTGTGMGNPGYQFEYEDSGYTFDQEGVLAMANSGPKSATNGSQFFITFGPTEFLDGGYTIFGQVTDGMGVVYNITRRDPETMPDFDGDMIESVVITEE
ncbi:MAG: peptidylprolyl isomerase [Chloroflexi bacterium HGW-Chloroflexi-4]|jgi:cyclophilin family peptidyl-prolyl cis-trans isomerase|nr:MAG: peptidylprolyl isomerase [Chloroflexi bacterium HGW-Chloroflexi-4]